MRRWSGARYDAGDVADGAGVPVSAEGTPRLTGWAEAMGIVIVTAGADEVVAELEVGETHRQAFGVVHGGVYCGLVETVTSMGAWLVAKSRGQSVMGLDNATSFIKATKSGVLRATAAPLARGRSSQLWEAKIRDSHQHVVAVGRVRFLCLSATESRTSR